MGSIGSLVNRRKVLALGATGLGVALEAGLEKEACFGQITSTATALELGKEMVSGPVTLLVMAFDPQRPHDLSAVISTTRNDVDAALITMFYRDDTVIDGRRINVLRSVESSAPLVGRGRAMTHRNFVIDPKDLRMIRVVVYKTQGQVEFGQAVPLG